MNFKNWKASLLLSIIIPMSLLATFRITGILQGPLVVSEVETLETIKWEAERPDQLLRIEDNVTSSYDKEVRLSHRILVSHYIDQWELYGGSDCITLGINVTASTLNGHIQDIRFILNDSYEEASLHIDEEKVNPAKYGNPPSENIKNLTVTDYEHWAPEIFVNFVGVDGAKGVSFFLPVDWILHSSYNQTHELNANFETIYFNGTAYKRIAQLFHVKMISDDNNSFQTATEIKEGSHPRLYIGKVDNIDYYKLHMNQSDRVKLDITGIPDRLHPRFAVYILDSEERLILQTEPDYSHEIEFTASTTGYYYVEVYSDDLSYGFYSLDVSL